MYGIYGIVNKITNEFYIGSAIHVAYRITSHLKALRNNIHKNKKLQHDYNKYGEENFIFGIIQQVRHKEDLIPIEQKWINYYESHNDYNICPIAGSRLGSTTSKSTKIKLSKIGKGRTSGFKGKHHSKETREKMSKLHMGHVFSEKSRRKISKIHKGKVLSKETKRLLSEYFKGRPSGRLGEHHSKETKIKISKSMTGKHPSDATKKKISKSMEMAWKKKKTKS